MGGDIDLEGLDQTDFEEAAGMIPASAPASQYVLENNIINFENKFVFKQTTKSRDKLNQMGSFLLKADPAQHKSHITSRCTLCAQRPLRFLRMPKAIAPVAADRVYHVSA